MTGLYTFSFAAGTKANKAWKEATVSKAYMATTPLYSYTGNVQFRMFAAGNELTAYFTDGQRVNFIILQQTTLTAVPADGKYQVDVYESGVTLGSFGAKSILFLGADVKASKDLAKSLGGKARFNVINKPCRRIYL